MKLAEALLLRSEYQQKIANLEARVIMNLKVQEGDSPHENPLELLNELLDLHDQLSDLIKKINYRNNNTPFSDDKMLYEALADREALIKKRTLLYYIANSGMDQNFRTTRSELKTITTVPIAQIHKQADDLSRQFRELDSKIQALNWNTDL